MEETKVQDDSKQEAAGLSAQDQARKRKKAAKAAVSFIVMILLLAALFFAAVNIGSLKVSFSELWNTTRTWQRSMTFVSHES